MVFRYLNIFCCKKHIVLAALWFLATKFSCSSGLRGAIAYALSLHLEFEKETRQVIITTTLIIVLFTTLVCGGLTTPLVKVNQIAFLKFRNSAWLAAFYLCITCVFIRVYQIRKQLLDKEEEQEIEAGNVEGVQKYHWAKPKKW